MASVSDINRMIWIVRLIDPRPVFVWRFFMRVAQPQRAAWSFTEDVPHEAGILTVEVWINRWKSASRCWWCLEELCEDERDVVVPGEQLRHAPPFAA
ncbi:hypothetical protein Q8A67_020005 [Cirrhinus molitorella]|uniref:Uncharacterized protein n=1 Tax=Cirrhinus molitorella TaxID=172907 RepID=A0AA88PF73_9TELE|nr:hypothetical protein Q8A67_020005 [Cirrhinus molitorella]